MPNTSTSSMFSGLKLCLPSVDICVQKKKEKKEKRKENIYIKKITQQLVEHACSWEHSVVYFDLKCPYVNCPKLYFKTDLVASSATGPLGTAADLSWTSELI